MFSYHDFRSWFNLMVQIASIFAVETSAVEINRQKYFLTAKTAAKTTGRSDYGLTLKVVTDMD